MSGEPFEYSSCEFEIAEELVTGTLVVELPTVVVLPVGVVVVVVLEPTDAMLIPPMLYCVPPVELTRSVTVPAGKYTWFVVVFVNAAHPPVWLNAYDTCFAPFTDRSAEDHVGATTC